MDFLEKAWNCAHSSWREALKQETQKNYWKQLSLFLESEVKQGQQLYPSQENIFKAFELTPLPKLKAVILGQDPYHGSGQAHGLAFSLSPQSLEKKIKFPPSLRNIFKELESDLSLQRASNSLEDWAKQGVLLLNTVLTVRAGQAFSHRDQGWESFTQAVIQAVDQSGPPSIFLLWGKPAQSCAQWINPQRHRILTAHHPSPLSAHRGFFGCRHFSVTNRLLKDLGREPISWA